MNLDIMSDSIALIPCRGGSKGIVRKNLQKIAGVPLVVRSINTARLAGVERIFVSTDDLEISEVAAGAGAEIIKRPPVLALDTTSTREVIGHACRQLSSSTSNKYSPFFLLQATSPFLLPITLRNMYESSNFSIPFLKITTYPWHGVIWSENQENPLELFPVNHSKTMRLRRQDMPKTYSETGAAYLSRFSDEMDEYVVGTRKVLGYITSQKESLQIDTMEDLDFCRSFEN